MSSLISGDLWSMKFFINLSRQPPSHRRLALIGVAVITMTVAAAGLTIWDWRKEAIKTSTQQIQNLGVVGSESDHFPQSFQMNTTIRSKAPWHNGYPRGYALGL